MLVIFFIIFVTFMASSDSARILAVIPSASVSHQVVFRPLTKELARRGHDVVVITTDPVYPEGNTPANLTEIDLHDISYSTQELAFAKTAKGSNDDIFEQVDTFFYMFRKIFEAQVKSDKIQKLIHDKTQHFDLLLIEGLYRPALIFSHIFKAPVILMSSVGPLNMINEMTGAAIHPTLYPTILYQRISNMTLWEKVKEMYKQYKFESSIKAKEIIEDEMLRRNFGSEIPPLKELKKNVAMLFMTTHRAWDNNRPVPPNHIYLGGIYPPKATNNTLPKDLKQYLDSSAKDVIYMSLGSNIVPSMLPKYVIEILLKVFSRLPYNILFKWDQEVLPGAPGNVKLFKWLPQIDLLRHPNVKLFITQGGQQSTEDAINAGVPLIGMPMLGDQWFNVESYVKHNIGLRLDFEDLTEKKMMDAIKTVVEDGSYRRNIMYLRDVLYDQPNDPLDLAIYWTEHVLRRGGKHLRGPEALMNWWEYMELDLVFVVLLTVFSVVFAVSMLIKILATSVLMRMKVKLE